MNFDIYKNIHVAVLYVGEHSQMPEELDNWSISDIDSFYDNLDMWRPDGTTDLEALFSPSKAGIRQHVADCHSKNVGFAGNALVDDDFLSTIKAEYMKRGYSVMEIKGDGSSVYSVPEDSKVKIAWD